MMDGYYHLFSSSEEEWAYYARYIQFMHDSPVGIPYKDLYKLLKDKTVNFRIPSELIPRCPEPGLMLMAMDTYTKKN